MTGGLGGGEWQYLRSSATRFLVADMDKKERKRALKGWRIAERSEIVAGMPISPEQLHELLNHLDVNLTTCDRTTKLTQRFLYDHNLEKERILTWLAENGGYCDCEVLANLSDLNDSLQAPPAVPIVKSQSKRDRDPRSLQSITGWNLSHLPSPWRVANLYVPTEPVRLQLGKKGYFSIQIIEAPLPVGDKASDEYWIGLWYARTDLPHRGSVQVNGEVLELPDSLKSVLVRAANWTPVYCWIFPSSESWYLEVRSESNRYTGDLQQISSLISHLAGNK